MPNSPLLDQKNIDELKAKLLEEKQRLEEELYSVGKKQKSAAGDDWRPRYENIGDDWDENAYEVAEFATKVPIESALEESLNAVTAAFDRIEANNYGWCEVDKKPIPLERLRVNPEATTCIEHAQ